MRTSKKGKLARRGSILHYHNARIREMPMYKITALLLFVAFSGVCQAEDALLVGEWRCKLDSKYMKADQVLTVNDDMTYRLVTKMLGTELEDIGRWEIKGKKLILQREFHIKRGRKKASTQTFKHKLKKLDENSLILKGKNTTTCSR